MSHDTKGGEDIKKEFLIVMAFLVVAFLFCGAVSAAAAGSNSTNSGNSTVIGNSTNNNNGTSTNNSINRNWTVNPGENIQNKINGASSGDTIIVNDNNGIPYEYIENLNINKLIYLSANGDVTIRASNYYEPVITINNGGSGSNISGFSITGATDYMKGGIFLYNAANCNISGNILTGNYNGLHLDGASGNIISSNEMIHNDYGVRCDNSQNNNFSDNNISNNNVGIHLGLSSNNIISNNLVNNNNSPGGEGIYINTQSCNNIISGNTATGNRYVGITTTDGSHNNQISNNNASNNGLYGISIDSSYNTISGNIMANNGLYGININDYYSSMGNSIYNNSFINNFIQAYVSPGASNNYFNSSLPIGGNYWSDYIGIDQNHDGFGDTPYLFNGGGDYLPVVIYKNQAPISNPDGPYMAYEGSQIIFDGSASTDPDGDTLTYEWDLDGDGIFETPGITVTKTWNDDYNGITSLKVTDSKGESNIASTNVTVQNLAPTANINDSYYVKVPITMRISGSKGNSVEIQIIQDGNIIASQKITRSAGSPNEQEVTIFANIDMSKPYIGKLIFNTSSDSSGSTPVWLIIDGKKTKVATFNTQKNNPSTYNQVYDFPLTGLFTVVGKEITFKAEASDPGTDNINFEWNSGNNQQPIIHTYTSDGVNPIIDTVNYTFTQKGNYTITLTVRDDNGAEQTYTKTIRIF